MTAWRRRFPHLAQNIMSPTPAPALLPTAHRPFHAPSHSALVLLTCVIQRGEKRHAAGVAARCSFLHATQTGG